MNFTKIESIPHEYICTNGSKWYCILEDTGGKKNIYSLKINHEDRYNLTGYTEPLIPESFIWENLYWSTEWNCHIVIYPNSPGGRFFHIKLIKLDTEEALDKLINYLAKQKSRKKNQIFRDYFLELIPNGEAKWALELL
jgi:hypothetical protein